MDNRIKDKGGKPIGIILHEESGSFEQIHKAFNDMKGMKGIPFINEHETGTFIPFTKLKEDDLESK